MNSYRFRRDKYVVQSVKEIQLAFLESHQQLGNTVDRIMFPKVFCGLKFSAKNAEPFNRITFHKYAFKKPWNNRRKQKMIFQVVC